MIDKQKLIDALEAEKERVKQLHEVALSEIIKASETIDIERYDGFRMVAPCSYMDSLETEYSAYESLLYRVKEGAFDA